MTSLVQPASHNYLQLGVYLNINTPSIKKLLCSSHPIFLYYLSNLSVSQTINFVVFMARR